MKAVFNVHGALTVVGEDATEWLALRTWAQNWTEGDVPLFIIGKRAADTDGYERLEDDCRQLFRTTPNNAVKRDTQD